MGMALKLKTQEDLPMLNRELCILISGHMPLERLQFSFHQKVYISMSYQKKYEVVV